MMQLQIQTIKQTRHDFNEQQENSTFNLIKDLFQSPKLYQPSQQILIQLSQIESTAKAHYHYLRCLQIKCFQILEEQDLQFYIATLEKSFLSFKYALLERRLNSSKKALFILNLNAKLQFKKIKQKNIESAKRFYQAHHLTKILYEMHFCAQIRKKQQKLSHILMENRSQQFLYILKQKTRQTKNKRMRIEETNNQVDKIYQKQILKKYFEQFKIHSRMCKLLIKLKHRYFYKFVSKLIDDKKMTLQIVKQFRKKHQLQRKRFIFESIQQNKLQAQCLDWYKYRIQKLYFQKWIDHHQNYQNQKQIDDSNQIILKHYLQAKQTKYNSKNILKAFKFWKIWVISQKQRKKQKQILESFATIKQKQLLQRKYFSILKQNKNTQKATKFYNKNLKNRVIEGLKVNLIKQSQQLLNVFDFIKKRTVGKYFKKIQLFVNSDKKIIQNFLLQKNWNKFSLSVVTQYFQKVQKANNYYYTLLKFKAIISLNENVQISKKAGFCAFHLNVSLPFKRWRNRFNIRRLVQIKTSNWMKRIFFEWKLVTIKRLLSHQNHQESDSNIEFQNMKQASYLQKQINFSEMIESKIQKKNSLNINQESQQISFFKKMNETSSDDDEIDKKVDQLLAKINTQRKYKKQIDSSKNVQKNKKNVLRKRQLVLNSQISERGQQIRLPTWSSPGQDYQTSIFQDLQY